MNIEAFDLNLLVVFDALLTNGSVTRAARRVGLSQPAFSNALARLRVGMGDPLFERSGRGMAPTPRALAMAPPIRAALRDVQRALAAPAESSAKPHIVTVAANLYAQCLVLPGVAKALMKRAPAVILDLRDVLAPGSAGQTEADVTIRWAFTGLKDSSSVLLRDSLVGVVRSANRAVGRTVTLAMFEQLNRIDVQGLPSFRLNGHLAQNGYVVPDALSAMCVVSQTDAVAAVPNRLARRFAQSMGLRIYKLPLELPDVALEVAGQAETACDPSVIVVRKSIVEAGKRLAGGRKS